MNSFKTTFLFLALTVLIPLKSFSKSYMKLGTIYMAENTGSGSTSRLWLDIGGGYLNPQGWNLGFLYSTEKSNYAGGSSVDRSSYGPTLGWSTTKDTGPYLLATYYLSSSKTNNSKGNGYQIDGGYKFALEKVSLALQLSQKHFKYDDQNGFAGYTEDRIDPYFVVWVEF